MNVIIAVLGGFLFLTLGGVLLRDVLETLFEAFFDPDGNGVPVLDDEAQAAINLDDTVDMPLEKAMRKRRQPIGQIRRVRHRRGHLAYNQFIPSDVRE